MESDHLSWQAILFRLGAVIVLILLNGFFVAAEFGLVGARPTRLRERAKKGNRFAALTERLISHNLDEVIAATQLGITIASLLVGWIGEQTLAAVFMTLFGFLPKMWAAIASHTVAATLSFSLITFLHVVIGELIPKTIGIRYPNRTALFVSEPIRLIMIVFRPFVWVLNGSGNMFLKLFGISPAKGHQMVHSVEELKLMIDASHQSGALSVTEKDLLQKIFKFGDLVARQVMVPRTEMSCFPANAKLEEILVLSSKTGHTRFPVYEKDIDNITGILHMKDLVRMREERFNLSQVIKEAHFVPELMPIVQLLTFFRQKHTQMVIVVDEFGGTSGLVTLEDVIEEIIGDFYDEHHPAVRDIVHLSKNEVLLRARVRLDEINERFRLELKSDEADTIGGYVLQEFGAIPRVGDVLEVPGGVIQVEEMAGTRIKTLRLNLQPQPVEKD
ncbi:hemolysin family protein [bacterium]|nr:hemolysin family protein [bacterium]MCI0601930.1 hemolysin family protein [bacterium]